MSDPNEETGSGGLYSNVNITSHHRSNITRVSAREGSSITKLSEPLTKDNWMSWHERIKRVLRLCGVISYAEGTIPRPNSDDDPNIGNWEYNDNYAQVMIINNITSTEMVHVGQCDTARAMCESLEAIHEFKGHQTIISII
jgi:hypothetical protein